MTLTEFLLARIDTDVAIATRAKYHGEEWNGWTPEMVLAECEAKLRILEAAQEWQAQASAEWGYVSLDEPGDTHVARVLATVYADHPDYREEWKP
jgi:hypothetical protein